MNTQQRVEEKIRAYHNSVCYTAEQAAKRMNKSIKELDELFLCAKEFQGGNMNLNMGGVS